MELNFGLMKYFCNDQREKETNNLLEKIRSESGETEARITTGQIRLQHVIQVGTGRWQNHTNIRFTKLLI